MRVGRRDVAVANKALILLTAKTSMAPSLIEEAKRLGSELLRRLDSSSSSVTVMARIRRDPFALASKLPGHDVTIELRADTEFADIAHALEGARSDLPSASDQAAGTVVLVGADYLFIPCPPQAVRFQYLMRRRPDLTHQEFRQHYGERHSEFGFKTLGVTGYAQLHVDPTASAEARELSGLGTCDFDGVSQLHMPAPAKFLLSSPINGARGMIKDEKRFVDRENSIMLLSRTIA